MGNGKTDQDTMSGAIQTELPEQEIERIQQVTKEFLARPKYEKLFETRIQKLIIFTEIYCILHYRKRMTVASYKPYMFGAYSEDVSDVLKDINGDVNRRKVIRKGKRTVAYSLSEDFEDSSLEDSAKRIIAKVHEGTHNKRTPNLAQFSKDNWLFEKTEYNHPMEFHEFADALDDNEDIQEALERRMPDKVEDIDESVLRPILSDS